MYSFRRRLTTLPAREDAERHQEGREDDEQHGDAVDPHAVAHEAAEPVGLLDELEAGVLRVEVPPDQERDEEGQRGDAERDVQDVLPDAGSPRMKKTIAARSGRKVTVERMGQFMGSLNDRRHARLTGIHSVRRSEADGRARQAASDARIRLPTMSGRSAIESHHPANIIQVTRTATPSSIAKA